MFENRLFHSSKLWEENHMKKLLLMTALLTITVSAAGCVGLIMSPFKEASLKPKETLNIQESLKIDKNKTLEIKKIAVPNFYDFSRKKSTKVSEDDSKMHSIILNSIVSELRKKKRFDIILSSAFQRKAEDLGLLENVLTMSEEELKGDAAKTGKELSCDAVLAFGSKAKKVDMGKAFLSVGFVGTVDVPVVYILELIDTKKGEAIYYQEQEAVFTAGQMGIKNTPDDELRKIWSFRV